MKTMKIQTLIFCMIANLLSKKRNEMKDKIFEVAKNHTENEETAMQLTNELCVLLGVSDCGKQDARVHIKVEIDGGGDGELITRCSAKQYGIISDILSYR